MWDGSAVPLDENLQIAQELLAKAAAAKIILEIEVGVVGGEEDGVEGGSGRQAVQHPEDALATVEALGLGEKGRYMTALTFGNVHGVYKPGNVKLRPEILKQAQEAVVEKLGLEAGAASRSTWSSTAAPARCPRRSPTPSRYGVVKMNVDTDTQYAFTRPVAGHMFANYDGVLKIDGEVGNKKAYDPRAWGKAGRGRDGGARRRGLREPLQHRHQRHRLTGATSRTAGSSTGVPAVVRPGPGSVPGRCRCRCHGRGRPGRQAQWRHGVPGPDGRPAAHPPARRPRRGRARRRHRGRRGGPRAPGVAGRLGDAGRAGARAAAPTT